MAQTHTLLLILTILVCDFSSGFEEYRDLWTFKSNNMVKDEEGFGQEEKRSRVTDNLDIFMPDVSPQKVRLVCENI